MNSSWYKVSHETLAPWGVTKMKQTKYAIVSVIDSNDLRLSQFISAVQPNWRKPCFMCRLSDPTLLIDLRLLMRLNLTFFVACPQIKPRLIQGHKTLPIIGLCRLWESEQFVWLINSNLSLHICQAGGIQCKYWRTNPKDAVRRRQTVAREMHMDCASFRTDANGIWLRAWRIALSITSGGRSECCSSFETLQWNAGKEESAVESAIASEPRIYTGLSWIALAESPLLLRCRQIVCWSIVSYVGP
jgi:hypothetical protein